MSHDQSVIEAFREAWDEHFHDVPWVERDIFVPVASHERAREFTFVFTGIEDYPLIDLVWREDGPGVTQAMNVDLQRTENGMGMKLTLEGFDSSWLHGFSLRQQGDCRLAALGLLQRDGESGWKTIYNSKRRCEAFKQFIADWYEQRSPEEQLAVAPLLAVAG